jgi:hypothetical protein
MAKQLFCFICKQPITVQDDRAIAKLCPEHDNDENRKAMVETPIRQLLSIQNEGLQILLKEGQETTQSDIATVLKAIADLKAQLDNLPTETTIIKEVVSEPAPNTLAGGTVNEFGEII